PNVIKEVMRHASIVLTMDTYGHLLPDQRSDAVAGLATMMTPSMKLAATGTVGAVQGATDTRDDAGRCGVVRTSGERAGASDTLKFPGNNARTAMKQGENLRDDEAEPKHGVADIVSPGEVMRGDTCPTSGCQPCA